jgi:hypothetical protein
MRLNGTTPFQNDKWNLCCPVLVHFTCQREGVYLPNIERVLNGQGREATILEIFSVWIPALTHDAIELLRKMWEA